MNYFFNLEKYSCLPNRLPDSRILGLASFETINEDEWICCRFSPHPGQENFLALGSNHGYVTIVDSNCVFDRYRFRKKDLYESNEMADCILDIGYLPEKDNLLIVLNGKGRVAVWDINKSIKINNQNSQGHNGGARCVSIWPKDPNTFVTGGMDGKIVAWDIRFTTNSKPYGFSPIPTSALEIIRSYKGAHDRSSVLLSKFKGVPVSKDTPSVTSLLHLDEYCVLSGSSSASTGLRIWDLRYQKQSNPMRTLVLPQKSVKESGVTSISIDRFRSQIFAVCTDNHIYEYRLSSSDPYPVRSLIAHSIRRSFIQSATSHTSDHMIVGTSNNYALIWDLQESKKYKQDAINYRKLLPYFQNNRYVRHPKFKLGGHRGSVECAAWNSTGEFIATMDEYALKIWSNSFAKIAKNGDYLGETIVDNIPVKLTYPELLSPPPEPVTPPEKENLRTPPPPANVFLTTQTPNRRSFLKAKRSLKNTMRTRNNGSKT